MYDFLFVRNNPLEVYYSWRTVSFVFVVAGLGIKNKRNECLNYRETAEEK